VDVITPTTVTPTSSTTPTSTTQTTGTTFVISLQTLIDVHYCISIFNKLLNLL